MTSAAAVRRRRRDYPGWHMVWALAVTETIAYAALLYCFAVMVVPMREDLGASALQLSGALLVGAERAHRGGLSGHGLRSGHRPVGARRRSLP